MYVEFQTKDGFSAVHVESVVILKSGYVMTIKRKKGEKPKILRIPSHDIMAIVKRSNFELITAEELEKYLHSKQSSL